MIEVTERAAEKLTAYLNANKIASPVRISVMRSCGGSSLGLSLDGRKESDLAHENEQFTLLIDQELSQTCGAVKVDYLEKKGAGCGCSGGGGFAITAENPLPTSGSICGSSCSTGSCGC